MTAKRLLILDDDPEFRKFVIRVAESCGFEARGTGAAGEFMALHGSFHPTIVILDLIMPEIDGNQATQLLAEADSRVPVLIISGFDPRAVTSAGRLGKARGLNIVATVAKPVRAAALADLLDRCAAGGDAQ